MSRSALRSVPDHRRGGTSDSFEIDAELKDEVLLLEVSPRLANRQELIEPLSSFSAMGVRPSVALPAAVVDRLPAGQWPINAPLARYAGLDDLPSDDR